MALRRAGSEPTPDLAVSAREYELTPVAEARGRRVMVGRGGAGNQARSPSAGENAQTEAEERAARSRSRTREDLHTGRGGPSRLRCHRALT